MDDMLLEPLKGYNSYYKNLHLENTKKCFDDLVKRSKINIEENKKTCKEYYKKCNSINELKKKISFRKKLKVLSIIFMILCLIATIYCSYGLYTRELDQTISIVVIVVAVILFIIFVFFIRKLRKTIKNLNERKNKLENEAHKLYEQAWQQMAPLNQLYDWGIPQSIVTKTVPKLQLDKNFDPEKYMYLHEKYNFMENTLENKSTCFVQSGQILGNPFLLKKDYVQEWYNKIYTGSIVIHWTTTESTKDGVRTVHHSQTLIAEIARPAPKYYYDTSLIYGNDAAPDLSFSRSPSGVSGKTEKEIEKIVSKGAKKLDKKSEKAVSNGGNYTRLGNDEFEVLYGGTNRNHEVQYRLLFTPLAQKNLLDIIKTPTPFGDDFYQFKDKCLNTIISEHSQYFSYDGNPLRFVGFDYDKCQSTFIEYNEKYFKGLYFDLAPLLSIPLYQQNKTVEYIYKNKYKSNITSYEHESIANSFDIHHLKSEYASTPSILKTEFISKDGIVDNVLIKAHAFNGQRRVTYVPKFGGDGRMHNVPVFWIEYIPVVKETYMAIENKDSTRYEFDNIKNDENFKNTMSNHTKGVYLFERGLFATLVSNELSHEAINTINKIYVGKNIVPTSEELLAKASNIGLKILEEQEELERISNSNLESQEDKILSDDSLDTLEVEYDEINEEKNLEETKRRVLIDDDYDED